MAKIAFDIETIPLQEGEYPESLNDVIKRKLEKSLKNNPDLDPLKEKKKIMATDPFLGRIVCIGLYYLETGVSIAISDPSEKVILEKWWKTIATHSGLFISFNGIRFDVPYIIRRSMVHKIKPTNGAFLSYTKYDPNPPHFDVMIQMSGRDGFISLHNACDMFGIDSPKDGAIKAENVEQAYKDGRIKEIAEYCLRDVVATAKVYEHVKHYIISK